MPFCAKYSAYSLPIPAVDPRKQKEDEFQIKEGAFAPVMIAHFP
jgi:hypothetical protein